MQRYIDIIFLHDNSYEIFFLTKKNFNILSIILSIGDHNSKELQLSYLNNDLFKMYIDPLIYIEFKNYKIFLR